MLTVYRREWKKMFGTAFGPVMLAVLLFCNGLCVSVYLLSASTSVPTQAQDALSLICLLLIPVLTCKAWPQERRHGTDAFLFSLPISDASLVLGKYLALASILGISFLPSFLSPLVLSAYGTVSIGTCLIQWMAFFFLCLFLLAICYGISFLFRNSAVAVCSNFGILVLIYLFPLFAHAIDSRLLFLEPFHLLTGNSYGRLDLIAFLLYIGGTVLCLIAMTQILAARRSGSETERNFPCARWCSKPCLLCAALAIALAVLSVVSPYASQKFFHPAVATEDLLAVSSDTESFLAELEEPITLLYLCEGGVYAAEGELYSFLRSYAEASPQIRLRVVDPTREADLLSQYEGASESEDMSLIVESGKRYRLISNTDLYYYQNSQLGNYRITPKEYAYYCAYLSQSGESELYSFVSATVSYFNGESVLTNAIRYCLQPSVTVIYTFGSAGTLPTDSQLLSELCLSGYDCRTLTDCTAIPQDCALLILDSPTEDLVAAESEALREYLDRGGKVLLTTALTSLSELSELKTLLSAYGMSATENGGIVCEGESAYYYSVSSTASPNLFLAHINGKFELTGNFDGTVVIANAHAISVQPTDGIFHTEWLYTSDLAYEADLNTGNNLAAEDARSALTVGALAQNQNGGGILWISSPNVASAAADAYADGGNFELLQTAISHWTSHNETALSVSSKRLSSSQLSVTDGAFYGWSAFFCVIVPLAVLLPTLAAVVIRKRR